MGVGSRGHAPPPWIFIHSTDIEDRGIIVLFLVFFLFFRLLSVAPIFGLFAIFWSFFPLPPPPWKLFCRRPCYPVFKVITKLFIILPHYAETCNELAQLMSTTKDELVG